MSKRVLITGATGFVGFHLIERALADGFEVYAAVRQNSNRSHLQDLNVRYIELDYASIAALIAVLQRCDFNYIIHAAGITKAKTKAEYNLVNAEYSRNLALAAISSGLSLEKFVFVSSLAALGPLHDISGCITEDTDARPVTSYGESKLLAERYLFAISGLPLLVIRPTAVYGPREKDIFILFKSISRGLEPYIGSFKQQLSFIYVKDLAEVIFLALKGPVTGRAYNVSDGHVYDRYVLAALAKKALNRRTFKFHLPVGLVGMLASVMDLLYARSKSTPALNREKMAELTAVNWACTIDNARLDLGFVPKFDLERGLADTISWYRQNRWL